MQKRIKTSVKRMTAGLLAFALVFSGMNMPVGAYAEELLSDETFIVSDEYEGSVSEGSFVTEDVSENISETEEETESVDTEEAEEVEEKEIILSEEEGYVSTEDGMIALTYMDVEADHNAPAYYPSSKGEIEALTAKPLPSKYNSTLNELKAQGYPNTRSQSPWGACWAHAAMATAEISMIKQGYANSKVDYSEFALAYFFYNTVEDPLGGTHGDRTALKLQSGEIAGNTSGTMNYMERGGNNVFTWRALATWMGATEESALEYPHYSPLPDDPDDMYAYDDAAILKDVRIFDSVTNRDGIKEAIMESGAVAGSIYYSDIYYDSKYNSYYTLNTKTNHAITLVGWDDDFPAENFSSTLTDVSGNRILPEGNGAWLLRNSWTTRSEMSRYSYMWISYYDGSLNSRNMYQQIFVPASTYDNNYQYDGCVETFSSNRNKVANIFTIKATAEELLTAVSFAISEASDVPYTIKIYENVEEGKPESGTLVSTMSGTTTYAGYYTINLDSPVLMAKNTRFSVVVETEGNKYVDVESGHTHNTWIDFYCESSAGESFVYSGNRWVDPSSVIYSFSDIGNICVKAFTKNAVPSNRYRIRFDGNGSTSGTMPMLDVSTGEAIKLPENTFVREGWFFTGWNTDPDGKGDSFDDGVTIEDAAASGQVLTLYAQWEDVKYSIIFYGNTPSDPPTDIMSDLKSSQGEITLFENECERSGYTFIGWSFDPDGDDTIYTPGTKIPCPADPQNTSFSMYAIWSPNTYTVTFDANGGSVSQNSMDVSFNEKYGELPVPVRENYDFVGWFTDRTDGEKITAESYVVTPTNNTLYAHWHTDLTIYNLEASVGSVALGYVEPGHTDNVTGTFIVKNTGIEPISITDVSSNSFTASFRTEAIDPGESRMITVIPKLALQKGDYNEALELITDQDVTVSVDIFLSVGFFLMGDVSASSLNSNEEYVLIDNATIVVSKDDNASCKGIVCDESNAYSLSIIGAETGKLTVYGKILIDGDIDISGGDIKVVSQDDYALYSSNGNINVKSGKLYASAATREALYANKGVIIVSEELNMMQPSTGDIVAIDQRSGETFRKPINASGEIVKDILISNENPMIDLTADTTKADFGNVPKYAENIGKSTILLTNAGNRSVHISDVDVSSNFFTHNLSENASIKPGETLEFSIEIKKDVSNVPGEYNGAIEIRTEENASLCIKVSLVVLPHEVGLRIDSDTEFVYTGEEIKPDIKVYYDGNEISADDYTVSYENNINACRSDVSGSDLSAPVIKVVGKGKFSGSAERKFTILPIDISGAEIDGLSVVYDGEVHQGKPEVYFVLSDKKVRLAEDTDYTLSYSEDPREPGEYTITLAGKGNYFGSVTCKEIISELTCKVSLDAAGGSVSENSVDVVYARTYGTLPLAKKDGYQFLGWFTSSEDRDEVNSDTKVTKMEDHTLYAHYMILRGYELSSDRIDLGMVEPGYTDTVSKSITITNTGYLSLAFTDVISEHYDVSYNTAPVKTGESNVITVSAKQGFNYGDYSDNVTLKTGSGMEIVIPVSFSVVNLGLWIEEIGEYDYSGAAIKPEIHVYYMGKRLSSSDYMVSYKNNKNAGNPTSVNSKGKSIAPSVTVKGKGNYIGTATRTFTINPLDISRAEIIDAYSSYNGSVRKGKPEIYYELSGKRTKLKEGKDYSLSYEEDAIAPGSYKITVTGMGNYKSQTTCLNVVTDSSAKLISNVKVSKIPDQTYSGKKIIFAGTPSEDETLAVNNGKDYTLVIKEKGSSGKVLVYGKDYKLSYDNNLLAGTAEVLIEGIGEYKGTLRKTFKINAVSVSKNVTVTNLEKSKGSFDVSYSDFYNAETKTFEYTGYAYEPAGPKTGSDNYGIDLYYTKGGISTLLKKGTDYVVSYKNNVSPGKAKVTFTGIGGYKGSFSKTFKIAAYDIAGDKVSLINYTGTSLYAKGGAKPFIKLTYTDPDGDETVLSEGKDYTVKYSNNTKLTAGENVAKATIKGKGNFKGTIEKTFAISGKALSDPSVILSVSDVLYKDKAGICKTTVKLTDLDSGKALKVKTDYEKTFVYTYKNDTIVKDKTTGENVTRAEGSVVEATDIIPTGTTILVTVTGKGNYSGTATGEFRFVERLISGAKVTINAQTYLGGKPVTIGSEDIVVKFGKNGEPLIHGVDYVIVEDSYKNNVKKGKASVTIKGISDRCGGTKTVKFDIKAKKIE